MENVEVQETIVETTLLALSGGEDSALRGYFGGATSVPSRRRLFTARKGTHKELLETTTMMVVVSYTLEDFSYSSPEQAMEAFRLKFADSWSSGDFVETFSTILLEKDPKTKVKTHKLSQVSNAFSNMRIFATGFNPTARPTTTPKPTAQPSTGMLRYIFLHLISFLSFPTSTKLQLHQHYRG